MKKDRMKTMRGTVILMLTLCMLAGCRGETKAGTMAETETETAAPAAAAENDPEEKTMRLLINEEELSVSWEDNETVEALRELAAEGPVTVEMSMYGGFEQVGALGADLPRNDRQTTTRAGDIVLYAGDQIVVFYGSNSWSYTRLGRIKDKTAKELAKLLGEGDVTLTIDIG